MKKRGRKFGKQGAGHIEVIISMVIFTTFLLFLFYLLNPLELTSRNEEIIKIAEANLLRTLEGNITKTSVILNEDLGCMKIPLKTQTNIIVKDENGEIIQSNKDSEFVFIRGNSGIYYIHASPEFAISTTSTADCTPSGNYRIGLTQKIEALSYQKILDLNQTYTENYGEAKNRIGLGRGTDYGFILFDDAEKEIVRAYKSPIRQTNIKAEERIIKVMYSNGEITNMKIRTLTY